MFGECYRGASPEGPAGVCRRIGTLRTCLEERAGCAEWEVELDGRVAHALAFVSLTGPLSPGDRVLLNTTAVQLGLSTGGWHFVISTFSQERPGEGEPEAAEFPGRPAGHILKLRYTPLQLRVCAAEEEVSPHREAIERFSGLLGMPVLGAELHSQAGAAAIAARAAAPGLRIALIQLDSAALPLSISRLAARLRAEGVLEAAITVGQAFGGDYEAINVYTGLMVAHAVVGAHLAIVTQGPGNVGTGTRYGFSGLALAEAFHAAATLGGRGILAARFSASDPRPRHQGLSHHTLTLLHCIRGPVTVPVPVEAATLAHQALAGYSWNALDPSRLMPALEPYGDVLTTMGRSLDQDPLFFRAAAAAGMFAAECAQSGSGAPEPDR